MHPLISDKRKLASTILVWLLLGVLTAKFMVLANLAVWETALQFSLPVVVVFGFIACSAFYVCTALPINKRRVIPTIIVFLFASVFAGGTWLALCLGWSSLASTMGWWSIQLSEHTNTLLFSAGFCCYLISLLLHDVLIAGDNVRKAELNAAKSSIVAREAELQMLRAQINPHFLFNSLNSISALTTIDGAAARAMTISLAQFFRQSLALSTQETIPLNQEIALCTSFLEVEKTRFGSKLQHEFSIEEIAQTVLIPPMLLQPLIENAIKHGIRDLSDGGVIKVEVFTRDKWLHIAIRNPCEHTPSNAIGNGLGLTNIKQRLINIYANQARIRWDKTSSDFVVEITLPLHYEAQPLEATS